MVDDICPVCRLFSLFLFVWSTKSWVFKRGLSCHFSGLLSGLVDGPSGHDLKERWDRTQDWDKGRVYILYAITDAWTVQVVVLDRYIQFITYVPWQDTASSCSDAYVICVASLVALTVVLSGIWIVTGSISSCKTITHDSFWCSGYKWNSSNNRGHNLI
jgi:hypothetical protein